MKPKTKFNRGIEHIISQVEDLRDKYNAGMNWDKQDGYVDACNDVIEYLQTLDYTEMLSIVENKSQ